MKPENVIGCFPRHTQPAALRSSGIRLLICIVLASAWIFLSAASLDAQQTGPNEFQVKAAYIYNFGKFVKWPADTLASQSGSFTICVLDQDPFITILQSTLAGESVGGKPVVVKRLPHTQAASACHILFINSTEGRDLKAILAAVYDSSVLTVSDMPDFSKRGGMIQFVSQGDRIRFEVNLDGAEKSHLIFPSELLKVAVAVKRPAGSGD